MSDESFLRQLRGFATEYVESKRKSLQAGKPQTQVDGGGSSRSVSFSGQDISRDDLLKIKDIRESGGIITSAYDAKALVRFGTGVEVQTDNDDLENWITENLPTLELLVLEMGEDATYYPYSVAEVVETRTGEFSHIEHIEPWTMLPKTDKFGDVIGWEQQLSGYGSTQSFDSDEIGHIVLNKSSGRDKTGISDVLQNKEEIETFRSNQRAMREATARLGYPFVHAKAGREGAAQLNDNELRRIRNRLADIGPGETQVTGPDIDIETIESAAVDFGAIQERDTRMLSNALGLPIEMLNEGSDGLGSGKPAEARLQLFALQNEAARRRFSDQFKREFLDEILSEYSPFDPESEEYGIHIKAFLDDKSDVAGLIQQVGDYMSANEVRERLDLPPIDDDEIGESYRSPAEEDTPADEQGGGFNALFSDGRMLNTPEGVPENAISITDRSEAPEDANIVTGPGGGLYYVPSGADGAGTEDIEDRANEDGTISAEDLVEGDVVIFDDEEITIQGVGTDETGTVVQFIDTSGEEYFIYEDLLGDFTVPGATDEDAETEPEAEPDADDESVFTEGETVTTTNGEEVTVVAYDEDTDVVLVELDDGEEILQTGDSIRDDAETETDATSERIADEVGLPDNVSVNLSELDEERANSVIEGLQRVDEALEIEEGDIFSLTTRPPDDVNGVAAAAFHTGNRTFYVNPDASTGEDRRADYEAGFLSTPTQQGNIMHEMIHSKHSRAALSDDNLSLDELREDNFSQDQKQTIRNEVSDYAATNGMEFVAEVGAGVLSGEEYSDEVMELYNNLGGPEVNT